MPLMIDEAALRIEVNTLLERSREAYREALVKPHHSERERYQSGRIDALLSVLKIINK